MVDSKPDKKLSRELLEEKNSGKRIWFGAPKCCISKIWKFFGFKASYLGKKFVFCALCDAKLKYCRNATNLFMHFKGQHPLIYVKSKLLQQKSAAGESCCSTCRAVRSTDKEDDSQRMLNETFQITAMLPVSSRRSMDIINAIGYFVVKDMLPISITNGTGFKRLLHVLVYVVPHQKTFTEKTIATCNVHHFKR